MLLSVNGSQATASDEMTDVYARMSGITRYVYEQFGKFDAVTGDMDYTMAGYITFFLVFILSAIVFKLGFARELPLVKNLIIYTFLFLGCILLTFFAFFLPMVEGLMVAALILIVYKSRMWRDKRDERRAANVNS